MISIGRRNELRPVAVGLALIVFIGVTVSGQEHGGADVKVEKSAEADKEVIARQQSRGLSDAEIARGKPSTLMQQIETGLTALSEFVSEGVDEYVSDKEEGKVEEASSKTHLHHLLKLGNAAGNAGPTQDGAPVGRADADDEDYRDQLAAVEDGLVDYAGLAGSPDKALGRGKQEGDQLDYGFGSGEPSAGHGGGSRSAIGGDRTATGYSAMQQQQEQQEQEQHQHPLSSDGQDGEMAEGRRLVAPSKVIPSTGAVRFDDDVGELRRRRTHTNGRDIFLPFYALSTLGPILC
uniref:Uncharacterized protein n=1 Tax=Anopheles culicifacies TaxID=139723 RepID=A0A182MNJ7_9DIPT